MIDVDPVEGTALVRTNFHASMYKLVRVRLNGVPNQQDGWDTVIEEDPKKRLDWVKPVAGDKLLVGFLEDVKVSNILLILATDFCLIPLAYMRK